MGKHAYFTYRKLWEDRMLSRFPEAYKKFFIEWKREEPLPVHYVPQQGKWNRRDDGTIEPVQNCPIYVKYPYEADDGIWGGEGILQGFRQPHKWRGRMPRFWFPQLFNSVVYSEILNKHLSVVITSTALQRIDEHFGFDFYLLKREAAEWYGLTLHEAGLKLMREEEMKKVPTPLKHQFRAETIQYFQQVQKQTSKFPWYKAKQKNQKVSVS